MERGTLQTTVWLLHYKHVDGSSEVGRVELLVEATTGGDPPPQDIHPVCVHSGEHKTQCILTQA